MQSKARFLGHPIHQVLIVFPLGLLATAVAFDTLALIRGNRFWFLLSFWMIAAGLIGGAASALFGVIDWLAIPPNTRANRLGLWHGMGNALVLIMFIGSWMLRRPTVQAPTTLALGLSFIAAAIAGVTGWMGGELVDRLGVGVDAGAHLNSPSSLSGRPAVENENATRSSR